MPHQAKENKEHCDSCIDTVKTKLEKLDGVKSISYNKNEFRITLEGSTEKGITTKALAELDYLEKD